ncbi:MAG: sulfotransferase [Bacteroidota bacterium]
MIDRLGKYSSFPDKVVNKIGRMVNDYHVSRGLPQKSFLADDSIIIFSEPRGGSTWLMELLGQALPVCTSWEPLHPIQGVVPQELQLGWIPYLNPEQTSEAHVNLFHQIHAFKIHNSWTRKYLTRDQIEHNHLVMVKYVRANHLIPFLLKHLTFNYPPIFLIRHPIDCCLSQIKNFETDPRTQNRMPQWLELEAFVHHTAYLNQLPSRLEVKIALWAIVNAPIIKNLDQHHLLPVHYSDLLTNPKETLEKISSKYQLGDPQLLDQINYQRASKSNFKRDFKQDTQEQLHKNINGLDRKTKDRIQDIFDHFGLSLFSAYSPYPKR